VISASLSAADTWEVVVEGTTETRHRVRMPAAYYRKLCAGTVTHEWLLIEAFRFLLEREPNTSILRDFELEDIARYFPEFESDMARRLAR
jgi:hypothetical protein